MRAGQAEEAQAVFRSLQSSGHDAYTGWLAITTQLFGAGQQAAARRLVETREPQWLPDADLYEHIIRSVCSSSEEHPFFYLPRTLQSGQLNNMDDHIRGALQALTEMQVWCGQGYSQAPLFAVALETLLVLHLLLCYHALCHHALIRGPSGSQPTILLLLYEAHWCWCRQEWWSSCVTFIQFWRPVQFTGVHQQPSH